MKAKLGAVPKPIEKALWVLLGLRDPEAPVVMNRQGEPESDPELRDNENVRLPVGSLAWDVDPADRLARAQYRSVVEEYVAAEVTPWVPDAWGRPRQDQAGLRDPADAAVLYVRLARWPRSTPRSRSSNPRSRPSSAR